MRVVDDCFEEKRGECKTIQGGMIALVKGKMTNMSRRYTTQIPFVSIHLTRLSIRLSIKMAARLKTRKNTTKKGNEGQTSSNNLTTDPQVLLPSKEFANKVNGVIMQSFTPYSQSCLIRSSIHFRLTSFFYHSDEIKWHHKQIGDWTTQHFATNFTRQWFGQSLPRC